MRALASLTFRPELSARWLGEPHVALLELGRLAPGHASGLARQVAGRRLPEAVIEEVVARADGVPLFLEELTRAMLGTGSPLPAIPSTLHDSLMARLDPM